MLFRVAVAALVVFGVTGAVCAVLLVIASARARRPVIEQKREAWK